MIDKKDESFIKVTSYENDCRLEIEELTNSYCEKDVAYSNYMIVDPGFQVVSKTATKGMKILKKKLKEEIQLRKQEIEKLKERIKVIDTEFEKKKNEQER